MEISLLFIKGWLLHQPTVSDGYTASICPGVVSCSKSALILTNSVCIQSCKLRSLLVSVTLLKEFQAFLTLFSWNPVTEGRCSFFHIVLLISICPFEEQMFVFNLICAWILKCYRRNSNIYFLISINTKLE